MNKLVELVTSYCSELNNQPIPADDVYRLSLCIQEWTNGEERADGLKALIDKGAVIPAAQLAGELRCSEGGKYFHELLQTDQSDSERTYTILSLGDMDYYASYESIQRFVGTEHDHQAIIALSSINLERTLPIINARAERHFVEGETFRNTFEAILIRIIQRTGYEGVKSYSTSLNSHGKSLLKQRLAHCNSVSQPNLNSTEEDSISSSLSQE